MAILGKHYQQESKILNTGYSEELRAFRSYLEDEGRSAHSVKVYCGCVRATLESLQGREVDLRSHSLGGLEELFVSVYPGRRLSRIRRSGLHAFWTFLRGTHSGQRLLPPLPESSRPSVDGLRSCLSGRGMSSSTVEQLLCEFRFFCRYLVHAGRSLRHVSWDDVGRYGGFLARDYLHATKNLRSTAHKLEYVSRCLEVLREDGVLAQLPRGESYVPSVVRHVVAGLGDGYRLLLASFSEYLEVTGMSATCVRSYPLMVRRFLVWLEGQGLQDIRAVDERQLLAYRAGPGRKTCSGGDASAGTRISTECSLRKFFQFLYRTRRIHADPSANLEYTARPRALPRTMLEASELELVLSSVDAGSHAGVRDLAVLELLYCTGLRSSELRGLLLSDVQQEDRILRVHGKGGKEALVPFGEKAARALGLYLAFARPCLSRRGAGADSGVVFLSEYGKRLTPNSLANIVRRRVKAAGIERNIVPHSLRHSCATHMLKNGADLRVVQQLLRHENINTTLVYTRLLTSDIRDAQKKFHPRELD